MALVATVVRLESRIEQALLELTTAAGADAEASGEGCDTAQVQRSAQKLDHARRMMRELAALVEVRPCGLVVRPQCMGWLTVLSLPGARRWLAFAGVNSSRSIRYEQGPHGTARAV